MPTPDANPPSPAVTENAKGVLAFPASVAQQMFWYLELLQGTVTAFNVPLRFLLTGPLDVPLFERALNAVLERHESLRTCFGEEDGELLQIVSPEIVVRIPVIDISHFPQDRMNEEADRLGSIEAHRPFDLSKAPLLRAEILRLGSEHHIFHFTVHHALFDGMSMTIFTAELAEFYQAFFENRAPRVEPLAIQYGDYSVWQKEFLAGPKVKSQLDYWKRKLDGMKEVALPTDFPRPAVKSWKGDITSILLPKELSETLQNIAAKEGGTLFHMHLAAFMILLRRYSGDLDVAVGAPVAGRSGGDLEPLIGVFINTLILRTDLSGNPTFFDYLAQIRQMSLESLENQELPFEHLVHELRPARDPSRNPLFQVNFNHHRSFTSTEHFGGVALTTIPSRSPGAIFDLHLFLVERDEGWRASLDFSTELFTRETADRMLGHLKTLFENIAANPDQRIEDFEILTSAEKNKLKDVSVDHAGEYPRDATIGEIFLETAKRYPERIAVDAGSVTLTYEELLIEASLVANELNLAGLKSGDTVATIISPGLESIIAIVGIILVGGCCAMIDVSLSKGDLVAKFDSVGARAVVIKHADKDLLGDTWSGTVVEVTSEKTKKPYSDLPVVSITAESPAHLLFTSGTSGTPKGVQLPHRGMTRLARCNGFLKISPEEAILQVSPLSVDASLLEIWGALLNGAKLVIPDADPSLSDLAEAIRDNGVKTLWLTSSIFQLMVDEQLDSLKGIRTLIVGGGVLSKDHARKLINLLPDTQLVNCYGPTENSTLTTYHFVTPEDLKQTSIPIGRPVPFSSVYLLDDLLRMVPVGVPGEICVGGDGLASDYFNNQSLAAQNFIHHPEFGRLLRTGDIGRRVADGTIEFLKRKESANLAKAASTAVEPIRKILGSAAGRQDGTVESRLTQIWQDLLGIPDIGPDDDFFALGGHSLMTLKMFSRIHREFKVSLPLATLLKHPTIASLAAQIEPKGVSAVISENTNVSPTSSNHKIKTESAAKSNVITLTEGGNATPLFCIHGGDGGVIFYRELAALLSKDIPFHAIESLELGNSGKIEETSIEETAASYLADILRIQPEGPFRLAGYSFGGVVAHEVACQLQDRGQKVEFLGMFDTHNPSAPTRNYGLVERLAVFWAKNQHLPLATRIRLLRERISEGAKTNRRVKSELQSAKSSGPALAYSDMRRIQVREENWRAMQAYRPRPFNGRITLFKTTHISDKFERPADYGWTEVAAEGLKIIPVHGEHLALFASENVENLAKVLDASLKDSFRPS